PAERGVSTIPPYALTRNPHVCLFQLSDHIRVRHEIYMIDLSAGAARYISVGIRKHVPNATSFQQVESALPPRKIRARNHHIAFRDATHFAQDRPWIAQMFEKVVRNDNIEAVVGERQDALIEINVFRAISLF